MVSDEDHELLDLLSCAIHLLLYTRQVYPQELFEQCQNYKVKTWQSRHPLLNSYISNFISQVDLLLQRKAKFKIYFVVKHNTVVLERFTFNIKNFEEGTGLASAESQDQFRGLLLKIMNLDGILGPNPKEVDWSLWIECDDEQIMQGNDDLVRWTDDAELKLLDGRIIPLRALDLNGGSLKIEMLAEESLSLKPQTQ